MDFRPYVMKLCMIRYKITGGKRFNSNKEKLDFYIKLCKKEDTNPFIPILCQIITENNDDINRLFFINRNNKHNDKTLSTSAKLSLFFADKVKWDYDYNNDTFIMVFTNKEQLIITAEEWKTFMTALELNYYPDITTLEGSPLMIAIFEAYLERENIKFADIVYQLNYLQFLINKK